LGNKPEYITVGRFGRPRGLSGEIYINSLSDNPERFKKPGTFWIEEKNGFNELKILSFGKVSGRPTAIVEGVNGQEQAAELTDKYLYIRSDQLGELPEGSYYDFDLINCRVINEGGKELGLLVDVEHYPANVNWVIETRDKRRRLLFPAVDEFVKMVDIEKKVITINPPGGIFDSPDED
jgi:16S rRNA processing protein RimM